MSARSTFTGSARFLNNGEAPLGGRFWGKQAGVESVLRIRCQIAAPIMNCPVPHGSGLANRDDTGLPGLAGAATPFVRPLGSVDVLPRAPRQPFAAEVDLRRGSHRGTRGKVQFRRIGAEKGDSDDYRSCLSGPLPKLHRCVSPLPCICSGSYRPSRAFRARTAGRAFASPAAHRAA